MKVSVCMAVYNGESFVLEQVSSILPQLAPEDELIISDDGSTDRTMDILKEDVSDPRLKLLKSLKKGIVNNFENALNQATGDIIFLSDQDDIWRPDKVETCKRYLLEYDLVFTNLEIFYEDINQTRLFYSSNSDKTGLLRNIIKNNYIGATMAFKSEVLKKALPFPNGIYMHDIWLALVAEVLGKTKFINEPLIFYRRHGGNASQTGERSSNSLMKKITMRTRLVYELILRFL